MVQRIKRLPRRGGLGAWLPLCLILLIPLGTSAYVFFHQDHWFLLHTHQERIDACKQHVRPSDQAFSNQKNGHGHTDVSGNLEGQRECVISEIGLVAAISVGAAVLVLVIWWMLTGLRGLTRIFEVTWTGLDDADVDRVGVQECVVRAIVVLLAIVAGLSIVGFGIAGVRDESLLWPINSKDPLNHSDNDKSTSTALSVIQTQLAGHERRLDNLDRDRTSSDHIVFFRPTVDQAWGAASDGSDTECFTPEFKADWDDSLPALRDKAGQDRRALGLADVARYRGVARTLVFFDTDVASLSDGAKTNLSEFLATHTVGKVALSIRGGADRQGSRPWNNRLSRNRAVNVARFIVDDHRFPPIVDFSWVGEDGPTQPSAERSSDPYNRIVRVIVLQACHG